MRNPLSFTMPWVSQRVFTEQKEEPQDACAWVVAPITMMMADNILMRISTPCSLLLWTKLLCHYRKNFLLASATYCRSIGGAGNAVPLAGCVPDAVCCAGFATHRVMESLHELVG
jgi:hypothetical protein